MSEHPFRRLAVFCGSSAGIRPVYAQAAASLGTYLASRGIGVVNGGGSIGMMGALSDATLAAGGHVTGVITRHLDDLELGHPGLDEMITVETMHERKRVMASLVDGFIALPGGYGTLEELSEATTWSQLEIHAKPVGILDVGGYFTPLVAFLDHATREGFVHPDHRQLLVSASDPGQLLRAMARVHFPGLADILEARQGELPFEDDPTQSVTQGA